MWSIKKLRLINQPQASARISTGGGSARPELTISFADTSLVHRGAQLALVMAIALLLVPTAQMTWLAKCAASLLILAAAWELRAFHRNRVRTIQIAPDDRVSLQWTKRGTSVDFTPVTLKQPIFVSPWLIAFSTVEHGRVVLLAHQTTEKNWRALRVRLNWLRLDQPDDLGHDAV
jgi:hypothetical protein